jgi:predicted nucleic acid-binding protein
MRAVVDTGPLVAFFDRSERYHRWTADQIEQLDAPLLVCEPVLTETIYLLARFPRAQDALFDLLRNGALAVAFRLEEHVGPAAEIAGCPNVAGRRLCCPHGGSP